jgi:hypothetical protein
MASGLCNPGTAADLALRGGLRRESEHFLDNHPCDRRRNPGNDGIPSWAAAQED